MFSNDNTQIRFLRAIAVTTVGTFQSGLSAIPKVFDLESENKYLREANIKLSNEIANLKESKLENLRLSKLLNFKSNTEIPLISAKIINKTLIQARNTITINSGRYEGIEIDMPIITDDGLVGRIISVSDNYALGQIILNKDMRISVKNQRTRVDGILIYDGAGNLTVGNVLKNSDVNPGDIFITSEYSNLYPPGIPVGTVSETGNLDNLFKKIKLMPQVNFNLIEEVFVYKYLPSKEREDLEKQFNKK
jgi:rod shape-determining protein MreC